jgi:molecular chaperone HscB
MQNHFDLFQLPARFTLDVKALDAAYRDVQGQVHPDRFVNATDAEKRVAMQWATRANEAYQTLKNPMKRARYLCEQNGVDLQTESNTAMPMDFLMQQMEWREALGEARADKDVDALEQLDEQVKGERKSQLLKIGALIDAGDYEHAGQGVRALMFLDKMTQEIEGPTARSRKLMPELKEFFTSPVGPHTLSGVVYAVLRCARLRRNIVLATVPDLIAKLAGR